MTDLVKAIQRIERELGKISGSLDDLVRIEKRRNCTEIPKFVFGGTKQTKEETDNDREE